MLAFALQQGTQAQLKHKGYLPDVVMLPSAKKNTGSNYMYLAPKQFSKMTEGSDDFACALFSLGSSLLLGVCACVASENQT